MHDFAGLAMDTCVRMYGGGGATMLGHRAWRLTRVDSAGRYTDVKACF